VRVKTAKNRTASSARWLSRQLNDPYVQQAQKEGYRSRAAFKILEMDQRFRLLKPGQKVVELGAAPGGWSQVVLEKIKAGTPRGGVLIAIDLLPFKPLEHLVFIQGDFLDPQVQQQVLDTSGVGVDLVLSDMAASTTGHRSTDHLRTMNLADAAFAFAKATLKEGGAFVTKVFQGGAHKELLDQLHAHFKIVKHVKPPASRQESPEMYVVCLGFRP
jgi:23S rRNA (uridine2552-2'-O)-methyltransferase